MFSRIGKLLLVGLLGFAGLANAGKYVIEISESKTIFGIKVHHYDGDKLVRASGCSFERKSGKLGVRKAPEAWVPFLINDVGVVLRVAGDFRITLRHREDRRGIMLGGHATDDIVINGDHISTEYDSFIEFDKNLELNGFDFNNYSNFIIHGNLRTNLSCGATLSDGQTADLADRPNRRFVLEGNWEDAKMKELVIGYDSTTTLNNAIFRSPTKVRNAGNLIVLGDFINPLGSIENIELKRYRGQCIVNGTCQIKSIINKDERNKDIYNALLDKYATGPIKCQIWAPEHAKEQIRFQMLRYIKRPILPGFKDENEQLSILFDNVFYERKALRDKGLGLIELGKHLTQAQQKALTRDIVWLVESDFGKDGKVMTLRVFFCENTLKSIQVSPSSFIANSINIIAPNDHVNMGLLEATNGPLIIQAGGTILNSGGSLISRNDSVTLKSGKAIINNSGEIFGKTGITIEAPIFVSDKTTVKIDTGDGHFTQIGGDADIVSGGDIKTRVTGTLCLNGTRVFADGDVTLMSGNTIHIGPAEKSYASKFGGCDWNFESNGISGFPTKIDGNFVYLTANNDVSLCAPKILAKDTIAIQSDHGKIVVKPFTKRKYFHFDAENDNGFLSGSTKTSETRINEKLIRPEFEGRHVLFESEGDIETVSLSVKTKENGFFRIESRAGTTSFNSAKTIDFFQRNTIDSGIAFTTTTDDGFLDETVHNPIVECNNVRALGRLAAHCRSGLLEPWLKELCQVANVELTRVLEVHDRWSRSDTSATGPFRTFLAVGFAFVLNGVGVNVAESAFCMPEGFSKVAVSSAIDGVANCAAVALVANKGDVDKAWKELSSSSIAKSIVAKALADGLTHSFVGDYKSIDPNHPAPEFGQMLKLNLAKGGIHAGTSLSIEGGNGKKALLRGFAGGLVDTGAQILAREIGQAYRHGNGDMGYFTHKLMHFVLGGTASSLKGGDFLSGGIGATVGEIVVDHLIHNALVATRNEVRQSLDEFGLKLTKDEFEGMIQVSFLAHLEAEHERIMRIGSLAAAGTALIGKLNVSDANLAAENAIYFNSIGSILAEVKSFVADRYRELQVFFDNHTIISCFVPGTLWLELEGKVNRGEQLTTFDLACAGFAVIPVVGNIAGKGAKKAIAIANKIDPKNPIINSANKYWTKTKEFLGTKVHQRDDLINPKRLHPETGETSLSLMNRGKAPIGPDGKSLHLHHILQENGQPLVELTKSMHEKYYPTIHMFSKDKSFTSTIDRGKFKTFRENYWRSRANDFTGVGK